jgi:hypothetical protein
MRYWARGLAASAQTAWAKRVSKHVTRAILGLRRLNFISISIAVSVPAALLTFVSEALFELLTRRSRPKK